MEASRAGDRDAGRVELAHEPGQRGGSSLGRAGPPPTPPPWTSATPTQGRRSRSPHARTVAVFFPYAGSASGSMRDPMRPFRHAPQRFCRYRWSQSDYPVHPRAPSFALPPENGICEKSATRARVCGPLSERVRYRSACAIGAISLPCRMPKKQLVVRLSEDGRALLEAHAGAMGVSLSAVVEMAVREFRRGDPPAHVTVAGRPVAMREPKPEQEPAAEKRELPPTRREPGSRPEPTESAEDAAAALFKKERE
jgi:hypothetical protein